MAKTETSTNITLTPSGLNTALRYIFDLPTKDRVVPFIWGPPGVGKSQIIAQIANDKSYANPYQNFTVVDTLGATDVSKRVISKDYLAKMKGLYGDNFLEMDKLPYILKDIRLSQMDTTDLRGIPYPVVINEVVTGMEWSPPVIFNRDPNLRFLYLLDELNSAPPSIQSSAYQLVLDRCLGEFKLMPHDLIAAAGNRDNDKGTTFKMAKPLCNRIVHIELTCNVDDWFDWAMKDGLNPDIIGYISFAKRDLFIFDPTSASHAFPTPRSWHAVHKMLSANPDSLPDNVLTALVAGAVGMAAAVQFIEYRARARKLPNPSDILSGKVKTIEMNEKTVSLSYSLSVSLCYELNGIYTRAIASKAKKDEEEFHSAFDNMLAFMMDNLQPELCVLALRLCFKIYEFNFDPSKLKNFSRFVKEHGEAIRSAKPSTSKK